MTRYTPYQRRHLDADRFHVRPLRPSAQDVCYRCRQPGHSLNACPMTETKPQCYRCGSDQHSLQMCTSKDSELKFASCFVCSQTGHLAAACPTRGYGQKRESNSGSGVALGKLDLEQGADDDDVFIEMRRSEKAASSLLSRGKAKKKVVVF